MANEGRYHPGAVKPNDSRLLSPAKKKALFASMGAKISDQKHTQEPPPPLRRPVPPRALTAPGRSFEPYARTQLP